MTLSGTSTAAWDVSSQDIRGIPTKLHPWCAAPRLRYFEQVPRSDL